MPQRFQTKSAELCGTIRTEIDEWWLEMTFCRSSEKIFSWSSSFLPLMCISSGKESMGRRYTQKKQP